MFSECHASATLALWLEPKAPTLCHPNDEKMTSNGQKKKLIELAASRPRTDSV
jgi:hypothetical protein